MVMVELVVVCACVCERVCAYSHVCGWGKGTTKKEIQKEGKVNLEINAH